MQLKVWLVRKHPSSLGMQLKHPVYKSCIHLRKFIVLSAVVALAVSLSRRQTAKVVMGVREKELGAWREKGEDSVNAASTP